jgi:hypothetical protein
MSGEIVFFPIYNTDYAYDLVGLLQGTGEFYLGHNTPEDRFANGAIRVNNVTISKNAAISDAGIVISPTNAYGDSYYFYIQGIDEDNTADFNASSVFGRPRTTASNDFYQYQMSSGQRTSFGCQSMVKEIVDRSGWSSGNSMAFVFIAKAETEHGGVDNYISSFPGDDNYLWVRLTAQPDFTPTPVSLTSQAFPDPDDYGIRLSKPGVDVKTATEHELYYTSRKRVMTVKQEGLVTTTANPHAISHGLTYTPMVMAFALSGGRRYQLPAVNYSGGVNIGYVSTTSTTVRFHVQTGTQVYYYIFYDQQP